MQAEEHHQAVHQDPEDGKRHCLTHDVTVLTLHIAGSRGDGDGLRREQFTTLRAGTVGSCQPVGFVTRYAKECALVHQSEVAGGSSLELTEEDVGIRGTTRYEGTDRTNQRSEEREGSTRKQYQSLGNIVGHTRIVHQHGHSHKTADGHHRLLQVDGGLGQQLHQATEAHALNQSADDCTEENHQAGIRQPAELKGIANHWQLKLSHQRVVQQLVYRRHNLTANQDEEDDQTVNTPSLEGLCQTELLLLHDYLVLWILIANEQFIIYKHGDDGCHRTEDGGCLRTDEVSAAELHHDGECTHEERYGDILHDLRTIGHHQDEERGDEEHQRELQDDERSHLTEFFGRSHTTGSHLVGQRRGGQTYGTEAYSHRIGHQTDDSREHRLEPQSDQDGGRDSHSRTEAGHTFEHATETPCEQKHQQSLI